LPHHLDFLPDPDYRVLMVTRVAVLALPGIAPFELGVVCEAFGTDRRVDGFPYYEFALCGVTTDPIRTRSGFDITPHAGLEAVERADLIAVPAHPPGTTAPPEALAALRRAHARGAWVMSLCSGAFLLGEAGLLDDRRCTTHWKYVEQLVRRFPAAKVELNSLYVQDGNLLTSAGTAAGIDACLHLVRTVHGSAVATALARRMVVPPHRDGGQAQYVEAPLPASPDVPTLEPLLSWLVAHLAEPVTVETLAARVHMSPRTFARRFRAEVGATPHDWMTSQRVLLARQLLEETELGIDAVAAHCGFGDSATLRHHFARRVGATPHSYRATFRSREATPVG
jgi:transcriptional regulator GlxA family with amidase domain